MKFGGKMLGKINIKVHMHIKQGREGKSSVEL